MNIILITTLVIAVIGICVGSGLVFTAKKFAVKVDEREVAVREKLPGNNCGACGFAGCDALAGAIARGEAPVNAYRAGDRRHHGRLRRSGGTQGCFRRLQGHL